MVPSLEGLRDSMKDETSKSVWACFLILETEKHSKVTS